MLVRTVFLHDVQSAADLASVDCVMCLVPKALVDAGDVESFVRSLELLSEDAQVASRFEGNVLLAFPDYSTDPREHHQIPELVAYFRQVTSRWNNWLHFLSTSGENIKTAVSMIMDTEIVNQDHGRVTIWFPPEQLQTRLLDMFEGMNVLHERLGVSASETCNRSDAIFAALGLASD